MKYLFIGGPKDGERIEIAHSHFFQYFHVPIDTTVNIEPLDPLEAVMCRTVCYIQMKFRGEKEVFTVFTLDGLTADDVFSKTFGELCTH